MTGVPSRPPGLQELDAATSHHFCEPMKKIHDGSDVSFFLTSKAYTDIVTFLLQLNVSMFPLKRSDNPSVDAWSIAYDASSVPVVKSLAEVITVNLHANIDNTPPEAGPRRFGNAAYRTWQDQLEAQATELLEQHLPSLQVKDQDAKRELRAYFLGSFGSKQRLDYGTGHELSFLAFLAGIWKLGGFKSVGEDDGARERAIVLGLIEPYLVLVRRLILTYTLEPAGSHGVWGLDDHSFLPYIFGSAQLGPAISDVRSTPLEGSISGAPEPGDVIKPAVVERVRKTNMYFSAIGFIYDVKKGPFWEHSPMLYDISGIRDGWAKINKGMIKMYIAEVLSKFPVVQHFPFGGLFKWEKDPSAAPPTSTAHSSAGPSPMPQSTAQMGTPGPDMPATKAPWANSGAPNQATGQPSAAALRAPWITSKPSAEVPVRQREPAMGPTKAPWAK